MYAVRVNEKKEPTLDLSNHFLFFWANCKKNGLFPAHARDQVDISFDPNNKTRKYGNKNDKEI